MVTNIDVPPRQCPNEYAAEKRNKIKCAQLFALNARYAQLCVYNFTFCFALQDILLIQFMTSIS